MGKCGEDSASDVTAKSTRRAKPKQFSSSIVQALPKKIGKWSGEECPCMHRVIGSSYCIRYVLA